MAGPEGKPARWKQGEHIALLGMTGSGKSYAAVRIAQLREYVLFVRTKPDDNPLPGFLRVRTIDGINLSKGHKYLLEPAHDDQRYQIARALDMVWKQGGWTVILDELWWIDRKLGLTEYVDRLTTQGRSKRITVVTGVQRPSWVSKFAFAEATHFVIFRLVGSNRNATDVKSVRDMVGEDVADAVMALTGHDFIYVHAPHRIRRVGNANALDRVLTL